MNAMKAQLHDDSGLGGLRKELDAIKSSGISELEKHMQGLVDGSSLGATSPQVDCEASWQCGACVDARWKGGVAISKFKTFLSLLL